MRDIRCTWEVLVKDVWLSIPSPGLVDHAWSEADLASALSPRFQLIIFNEADWLT